MLNDDEKKRIHHRLRRIIGQVEAIDRMVGEDVQCIEVVMQVSAATGALSKVARLILEDHLKHSLASASMSKSDAERQAILDELIDLIEKYSQT
ncbi:metal-sensitive transcriptional regulator [Roseiconus nitratireducens]|uniref:Metal-sensitive transcriptional regulator n=2 Tax=Roseiconus nitratireducens TaxID=2605748 RepID=A0A5M6CZP2_9BACT|nr:metal-sensitive transcriptional regulator [Roseiconus nitratireducens]